MGPIRVSEIQRMQAASAAAEQQRDLRKEEGRMYAAVENAITMRLYDVGRIDANGRAFRTADEYEINVGMMALLSMVKPMAHEPEKVDHGDSGHVSDEVKILIDDMRNAALGNIRENKEKETAETAAAVQTAA
jgi:hypothetical protein